MIRWPRGAVLQRLAVVGALLQLSGCFFDSSGLPASALDLQVPGLDASRHDTPGWEQRGTDQAGDRSAPDLNDAVDLALFDAVVADNPVADTKLPDQAVAPDSTVVVKPVSAAALGQSFFTAKVPCVLKNGQSTGGQTPVADSASVALFNGTITLKGASAATLAWVGGKPSVAVLFDINACDDEAPSGNASWSSAGLLVRGATLASGALVLTTGTTVKDINLLDINTDGTLQGEFVKPDDSLLYTYPQLVNPTNKAKALILTLAGL